MYPSTFRTLFTIALLAFFAGLTLPITETATVGAMPAGQPSILPTPCPSNCVVTGTASAHPYSILEGEDSTVRIHIDPVCDPSPPTPLHLILAVDNSSQLDRTELQAIQAALTKLVDHLDLPNHPSTQLSLIALLEDAVTLVPPVNDADRMKQGIARLRAEGEADLNAVLQRSHQTLRRMRKPDCDNEVFNEIVIVASAPDDAEECRTALRSARSIKQDGILIIAIEGSPRARGAFCLREVASSARYYYLLENADQLLRIFDRIRDEVIRISLRYLQVIETVAENSDVVPNSAEPPAEFDPVARTLTWERTLIGLNGITLTYRLRPRSPGLQMVSEGAEVNWRDNRNRGGSLQIIPSWMQVFAPRQVDP